MAANSANLIEKIVIVFLENHTYDNMASEVAGGDGDLSLPPAPDLVIPDPPHDHGHWMRRNDPAPKGARRERYGRSQLPVIHGLMDAFSVCDRYFTDVAANSFPNHAFVIGADAEGEDQNPSQHHPISLKTPGLPIRLEDAGRSWANYGKGFAFDHYADPRMHANKRSTLAADASNGALPDVSWVFAPPHQDFHAGPLGFGGSSMSASDAWLGATMSSLVNGHLGSGAPLWDHLAVFITFDDWGGWSDHVVPPVLERMSNGDPYRYGSRVPCVIVSPYARPKFVSHVTSSHTSLVAFVERRWGLPPSPNPDAAARTTAANERAMADCFDFGGAALAVPSIAQPAMAVGSTPAGGAGAPLAGGIARRPRSAKAASTQGPKGTTTAAAKGTVTTKRAAGKAAGTGRKSAGPTGAATTKKAAGPKPAAKGGKAAAPKSAATNASAATGKRSGGKPGGG